jgi:hypothetical protein
MAFRYTCSDFPGMALCPGVFTTESEGELWKHIELHAADAHGEDPAEWGDEDRATLKSLITSP